MLFVLLESVTKAFQNGFELKNRPSRSKVTAEMPDPSKARVSQKSGEFFLNSCISVNSLSLTMMFDFYESVAIQLSKTCLSL